MNRQFIDVDKEEIKRLSLSGHNPQDIADYLGVSRAVVRIRLRDMGLAAPLRKGKKYAQDPIGATHQAYFRHIKPKYEMVCLKCGRKFKSWDRSKNRLCRKCGGQNSETYEVRHVSPSDMIWAARMM